MATVVTGNDLIALIRKSGVIDAAPLDEFLVEADRTGGLPAEPRPLAERMVQAGLITRFQARFLLQGKWRNLVLNGKYRLLGLIGSGGMGTVYLCEHVHMKRRAALKVLPNTLLEHPTAVQRFLREAQALARLDHPNIVRAYDLEMVGNLHAMVLEYVDGLNLFDLVQQVGPLPVDVACHYIAQAAWGLQHAADAGWVHRDVKPNNLLVDRGGTIKILDLGLARMFDGDDGRGGLTEKHDQKSVLGTADFLSPEQAMNSSSVDARADIYALGATFYYLLAGHPPFPGGNLAQKLIAHQTKAPIPVREVRPEVPVAVSDLIRRMMAKRPEERVQRADDVVAELNPLIENVDPVLPDFERILPPSTGSQAGLSSAGFRVRGPNSTLSLIRANSQARTTPDVGPIPADAGSGMTAAMTTGPVPILATGAYPIPPAPAPVAPAAPAGPRLNLVIAIVAAAVVSAVATVGLLMALGK